MKIRLIGSRDLVGQWAKRFEETFGIRGSFYPSRHSENEARWYADIDDRTAQQTVEPQSKKSHRKLIKRGGQR